MKRADRVGFTLIEVMVALTLGGLLVLSAHRVFAAAELTAGELRLHTDRHEVVMQAREELRALFGSLDITSPGIIGFRGTSQVAAFTSLRGGNVRVLAESGWLLARGIAGDRKLLPAERVTFDYLLGIGATQQWVRTWESPASAPTAVRLRLWQPNGAADTILLTVGERQ